MTIEILTEAIPRFSSDRYQITINDAKCGQLMLTKPEALPKAAVVRLKRNINQTANWRTILLAEISNGVELTYSSKWAAIVRDELLNSESSDLYLFIIPQDASNFSLEECVNIEANDQFCRKYVVRPTETPLDFLNRTFLYDFAPTEQLQEITDPLILSLLETQKTLPFFDEPLQRTWREALLSGKTGLELADILFEQQTSDNQNDPTKEDKA